MDKGPEIFDLAVLKLSARDVVVVKCKRAPPSRELADALHDHVSESLARAGLNNPVLVLGPDFTLGKVEGE
jgi:hypothetical protein